MNKVKFKILVAIAVCFSFIVSFSGCSNVEDKSAVGDIEISQVEETNEGEKLFEEAIPKNQEETESTIKSQPQNDVKKPSPSPTQENKAKKELAQDTQSEKTQATDTPSPTSTPEGDTDKETLCSLYVHCKSVLQNYDKLKENKKSVIPSNGVIYQAKRVSFCDGDSVFDVLKREMQNNKIQLEFVYTPMYNSVYIEGIGNLYEFDCGDSSGWQYKVNGVKPNYGCSQYIVNEGDIIEFYYSCNFLGEN